MYVINLSVISSHLEKEDHYTTTAVKSHKWRMMAQDKDSKLKVNDVFMVHNVEHVSRMGETKKCIEL